ncbi:MAG: CAP domain-containing protein [Bacteroidota bacterium]
MLKSILLFCTVLSFNTSNAQISILTTGSDITMKDAIENNCNIALGTTSGHYTQMVWKNTKEVGVGVSTCPNGAIIIVANYFPAGNYMRQFPY